MLMAQTTSLRILTEYRAVSSVVPVAPPSFRADEDVKYIHVQGLLRICGVRGCGVWVLQILDENCTEGKVDCRQDYLRVEVKINGFPQVRSPCWSDVM